MVETTPWTTWEHRTLYDPTAYNPPRRHGVVLNIEGEPSRILLEIYELILNGEEREYLLFQVIEWCRDYTVDELDVTQITSLVMNYIFDNLIHVIGETHFGAWYKREGQVLRSKLILFTLLIKERLLDYGLYDCRWPETAKLPHAFLSQRGRDALLLAYVEPSPTP